MNRITLKHLWTILSAVGLLLIPTIMPQQAIMGCL